MKINKEQDSKINLLWFKKSKWLDFKPMLEYLNTVS
jgi:hypothetical protein